MSLAEINNKIPSLNGFSQILLKNNAPVWADSAPSATVDSNNRNGWYYTNTSAGNKANIYFFGGTQETVLVKHLNSIWAKLSIDNNSATNCLPFFNVYTKPTGVGDAGAFYHSRFTYTLNSNVNIGIGEEVVIHTHHAPDIDYDCRFIPMPNVSVEGDGHGGEEILYMTIHTDSGAVAGEVKILFQNLGFRALGNTRNLHLVGYTDSAIEYPVDGSGVLMTVQPFNITQFSQIVSLTDSSYGYSNSVHNTSPSKGDISIWGNSNTQNTDVEVQYSHDDITWYFASNHFISFHGGSNGDFALDFKTNANYIRVAQFNNHGSVRTLSLNIVLT
tara:strand:+ start:7625 stop:8617 length:993 start_codon:yes stop_codon:yes gene_type:complete